MPTIAPPSTPANEAASESRDDLFSEISATWQHALRVGQVLLALGTSITIGFGFTGILVVEDLFRDWQGGPWALLGPGDLVPAGFSTPVASVVATFSVATCLIAVAMILNKTRVYREINYKARNAATPHPWLSAAKGILLDVFTTFCIIVVVVKMLEPMALFTDFLKKEALREAHNRQPQNVLIRRAGSSVLEPAQLLVRIGDRLVFRDGDQLVLLLSSEVSELRLNRNTNDSSK